MYCKICEFYPFSVIAANLWRLVFRLWAWISGVRHDSRVKNKANTGNKVDGFKKIPAKYGRQMFLVPACFSFEGPPLRTNWKPQPCHERAYNHKSSRKSLELSQAGWIIKRSIYIVLSFCSLRGRRKKERGKGEEKREGWVFVTFLPCACLSFRDGPLETLWGGGGREFSSRRNFFSLLNSLYEFFLGHSMNIF